MSSTAFYRFMGKKSDQQIRCPQCLECLPLKEYVKNHAPKQHGWKLLRACVFCLGGERWERGCRNYGHIVPCMKQFVEEQGVSREAPEQPLEEVKELPMYCKCILFRSKPFQMYGRVKDRTSEWVGLYDAIYERPDQYPSEIEFTEESGLGREMYGIIKRYEKGDLIWCHLMVRHNNFDNFVRAMKKLKHQFFLLPYWCLCDGLTSNKITHRHMIIAYEPECTFPDVWKNEVRCKVPEGGKSKLCVPIKDTFHLVRTIMYVSQRRSSCDGTQVPDRLEWGEHCSHFFNSHPMDDHAIVSMCTMFEGGMECLLKEQLRNKKVVDWTEQVVRIRDNSWNAQYAVPIGVTGFKFLHCVLPLAPGYEPTEERTELYLTWLGDKRLYLRINPNPVQITRKEWAEQAMVNGNTVWCLKDEWYVLGRTQQKTMNQIKEAVKAHEQRGRKRLEEKYRQVDQEKELVARRKETVTREENWVSREKELMAREMALVSRKEKLLVREMELMAKKEELLVIEKELLAREKESVARKEELLDREKASVASEKELVACEKDSVARKEELLARKEESVARREKLLARKEESVASEKELLAREKESVAFEKELLARKEEKWYHLKRKLSKVAVSNCESCLGILKEMNEVMQDAEPPIKKSKSEGMNQDG